MKIITYFGGCRRAILEEEIVNAGWVYAIGIPPPPKNYDIIGFVGRASSMQEMPHEVKLSNIGETCTS